MLVVVPELRRNILRKLHIDGHASSFANDTDPLFQVG